MKGLCLAILIFFVIVPRNGFSKSHYTYLNFQTTDSEKRAVFELWKAYLNSDKVDTFWAEADRKRFPRIDLLNNALGLDGSLYNIYFKCNVMGIYDMGSDYLIKSALYWNNEKDSGSSVTLLAIINVLAIKENGEYKLSNYINYSTKNWMKKNIGRIKYRYPVEFPFDEYKARDANIFLDSLVRWLSISSMDTLNYFIPVNCTEGHKMVGYEYFEGDAKKLNLCGYFDEVNNIIYSNSVAGEFYEHELVHVINKEFPNANLYFLTGLAAYINDAGSFGKSEKFHLRRYLQLYPQQNLNKFYEISYLDDLTAPNYLFGAVICHSLLRRGGIKLLTQAMSKKLTNQELIKFLLETCKYKNVNQFFSSEFSHFLNEEILLKVSS
jgi:hypothetical protein